jgi:hypothetical protein
MILNDFSNSKGNYNYNYNYNKVKKKYNKHDNNKGNIINIREYDSIIDLIPNINYNNKEKKNNNNYEKNIIIPPNNELNKVVTTELKKYHKFNDKFKLKYKHKYKKFNISKNQYKQSYNNQYEYDYSYRKYNQNGRKKKLRPYRYFRNKYFEKRKKKLRPQINKIIRIKKFITKNNKKYSKILIDTVDKILSHHFLYEVYYGIDTRKIEYNFYTTLVKIFQNFNIHKVKKRGNGKIKLLTNNTSVVWDPVLKDFLLRLVLPSNRYIIFITSYYWGPQKINDFSKIYFKTFSLFHNGSFFNSYLSLLRRNPVFLFKIKKSKNKYIMNLIDLNLLSKRYNEIIAIRSAITNLIDRITNNNYKNNLSIFSYKGKFQKKAIYIKRYKRRSIQMNFSHFVKNEKNLYIMKDKLKNLPPPPEPQYSWKYSPKWNSKPYKRKGMSYLAYRFLKSSSLRKFRKILKIRNLYKIFLNFLIPKYKKLSKRKNRIRMFGFKFVGYNQQFLNI